MKLLVSMILVVAAVALTSGSVFAIDRCNYDNAYSYGVNSQTGAATWRCKFDKHLNASASHSWYYFCSYTYADENNNPVYVSDGMPSQIYYSGVKSSTGCTNFRSPGGELGAVCTNWALKGDSFSIYPECGGDRFSGGLPGILKIFK